MTQPILIKITIAVLAGLAVAGPLATYLVVRDTGCADLRVLLQQDEAARKANAQKALDEHRRQSAEPPPPVKTIWDTPALSGGSAPNAK
ncbi:MAG: hypothetical protein ACRC67_26190 [Inquilinus sp.]|uniref:hypothetical protein n=1 Tax=Inquilinus sp. TaxID=1932117 RepID=UPI003F3F846A